MYKIFNFECGSSLWLLLNGFNYENIFTLCLYVLLNIWIERWTQAILSFTFMYTETLKNSRKKNIHQTLAFGSIHPFSSYQFSNWFKLRLVSVSMLNAYGSFRYFPSAIYTFVELSANSERTYENEGVYENCFNENGFQNSISGMMS